MLRLSLFTLLLATVILTSLFTYNRWENSQTSQWKCQTVGGQDNGCQCTQRLER